MKEELYHIFKVDDYRGGNLITHLNLTYRQLIDHLVDQLDEVVDGESWTCYMTPEQFDKFDDEGIDWDYLTIDLLFDTYWESCSIYAGGVGFCEEWYYTDNSGKLKTYRLTEQDKELAYNLIKHKYETY